MHRSAGNLVLALLLVTPACFVPKDATPSVAIGGRLASKYVHRGMTLVDNPVLQPRLAVGIPVEGDNGDKIKLVTQANIDLRNDTGDAWFPDGHAGRATEFELIASYSRRVGDLTVEGGIHNYNLPNGQEFANGERGGTSELFLLVGADVLETTPYFSINYDFDEVRAAYYRGGVTEDIPLGGNFKLTLDGSLGYAASGQSAWMYGIQEGGFADLRGEMIVKWQCDDRTQLEAGVHGSMIVDSTIDDWFSNLGIDSDPIWFTVGVIWGF